MESSHQYNQQLLFDFLISESDQYTGLIYLRKRMGIQEIYNQELVNLVLLQAVRNYFSHSLCA